MVLLQSLVHQLRVCPWSPSAVFIASQGFNMGLRDLPWIFARRGESKVGQGLAKAGCLWRFSMLPATYLRKAVPLQGICCPAA